ncbi:MAG: hypothetical protein NT164_02735 [Verrucomicrobiae bacterium]|nr:hypothetical protein [Verrucomicrobiae bacterium]
MNYVQDLLFKTNEKSPTFSQSLADFVSPSSITYQGLATRLSDATNTTALLTTSTSASLLRSQQITTDDPTKFLQLQGITMGKQIGRGAQGRIYPITYQGNENDYLYKEESSPHLITDPEDQLSGHKFYRIGGDIAAARCKLPNTIESVGFFLKIIKNPKQMKENGAPEDAEYHYLPNTSPEKIKADAQTLLEEHPGAEIFLSGQIMKRAPGETLGSLISEGKIDTTPENKPFKNIVYGLYSFLAAARPRNFVHRDIKPDNLVFDQNTGQLTVIDNTSGRHLARRNKAIERESSVRPSKDRLSNRGTIGGMIGATLVYALPAALDRGIISPGPGESLSIQEKEYGAEFDCFSTAMTLLALIHKDDVGKYCIAKFPNKNFLEFAANELADQWGDDPKKYLEKYLSWIGGDTSKTHGILAANSDLKNCLQLLFEASAAGEAGEAAFAQLATDPYLVACKDVSLPPRAAV